ncbi:MAG: hypothetical protein PHQ94_01845 [Syntrophomonas sp.]|nr:hypothetical protein [Syntrophomonas sp.]
MRILVSIDDTDTVKVDNVDVRGTGEMAELIAKAIEDNGWGSCQPITRHQLLIHPDIPYTSHNSSMCFAANIESTYLKPLIDFAADFLACESAPDADPGLCIAIIERISRPGWLISFGYMAKNYVLTKENAYDLAEKLGIHLSEHGGTGLGVIGALAGAGLRLGGNDGRFKGKLKLKTKDNTITTGKICSQSQVDIVKCLETGAVLHDDELVLLGDWVKTILHYGQAVLPVSPVNEIGTGSPGWKTYSKKQMKDF